MIIHKTGSTSLPLYNLTSIIAPTYVMQSEMANPPTPDNAQDKSAPPIITPSGNSVQPTLRNLNLNHEWMIGEPVSRESERHAAIYSILVSETGRLAENLEAHVFALDGIEPKLRKHRQRCIKRMQGRTKLKVEVNTVTIVVITTSQTEKSSVSEHEPHVLTKDGKHETDSGTTFIRKLAQKTLYLLEVRRQAKQRAEIGLGNGRTADDGHEIAQEINQEELIGYNKKLIEIFKEFIDHYKRSINYHKEQIEFSKEYIISFKEQINYYKEGINEVL